jgi:hypothetical protein
MERSVEIPHEIVWRTAEFRVQHELVRTRYAKDHFYPFY